MIKKFKKIPVFKNEVEESKFWMTHDSTEYVDWSKARNNVSFPNLKRSTESISIRFASSMLADLKMIANKKDVPYQSLIKIYLADLIKKEIKNL